MSFEPSLVFVRRSVRPVRVPNKSEKVKRKQRKGKSHRHYMLPPRGRATADVAVMLLDPSDDLTDVINRAHFGGCRLRG